MTNSSIATLSKKKFKFPYEELKEKGEKLRKMCDLSKEKFEILMEKKERASKKENQKHQAKLKNLVWQLYLEGENDPNVEPVPPNGEKLVFRRQNCFTIELSRDIWLESVPEQSIQMKRLYSWTPKSRSMDTLICTHMVSHPHHLQFPLLLEDAQDRLLNHYALHL